MWKKRGKTIDKIFISNRIDTMKIVSLLFCEEAQKTRKVEGGNIKVSIIRKKI